MNSATMTDAAPAVLIERLHEATMSTAEAAEFLGKPESTVRSYRWRGSGHGRLRSIRLDRAVRIYRADVEQYKRDLDKQSAQRVLEPSPVRSPASAAIERINA